jgi:hypothetical protein
VLPAPVTKPGEHEAHGARAFTTSRIAFAVLLKSGLTQDFVIEYCLAQLGRFMSLLAALKLALAGFLSFTMADLQICRAHSALRPVLTEPDILISYI